MIEVINKIGIVGKGFVGEAVANSYDPSLLLFNDPKLSTEEYTPLSEMVERCSSIFVCVPTPSDALGKCSTGIIEQVLRDLSSLNYRGLVICKSTAPPLWYKYVRGTYQLKIAHVPEFLTQVNANKDYLNQSLMVIGAPLEYSREVEREIISKSSLMYRRGAIAIVHCSVEEASMFKYMANTFLAMKVVISNEFSNFCKAAGIDYEVVSNLASFDPRLGGTHWKVPGPDGKRGFGGACFPKDTAALLASAEDLDVDMSMLKQAVDTNDELRW